MITHLQYRLDYIIHKSTLPEVRPQYRVGEEVAAESIVKKQLSLPAKAKSLILKESCGGERGENHFPTFFYIISSTFLSRKGGAHHPHLSHFGLTPLIYKDFLVSIPGENPRRPSGARSHGHAAAPPRPPYPLQGTAAAATSLRTLGVGTPSGRSGTLSWRGPTRIRPAHLAGPISPGIKPGVFFQPPPGLPPLP